MQFEQPVAMGHQRPLLIGLEAAETLVLKLKDQTLQIVALALRSLREYWLMPLVTTQPASEAEATTVPPGHMQKL